MIFSNKTSLYLFSAILLFGGWCAVSASDMPYSVHQWEIPIDEAVKKCIPGREYGDLDIDSMKEYGNNVYNHIVSSNPDIKPRIRVLRSKGTPVRDLLFLDNKLYEILEYRDNVDSLGFKEIFVSMKNEYGIPEMTKETEFTVYTYKKAKTQAIVIAKQSGDKFHIRIYLYSKSLFRRLFED